MLYVLFTQAREGVECWQTQSTTQFTFHVEYTVCGTDKYQLSLSPLATQWHAFSRIFRPCTHPLFFAVALLNRYYAIMLTEQFH